MGKHKIVFDPEDRKKFLKESKYGKYTKREKEEYKKKIQIQENRKDRRDKNKLYKETIELKYKELSAKLKEVDDLVSDNEDN